MREIPNPLTEAALEIVRDLASCPSDRGIGGYHIAERARALVSLLPKPIDPDLIEAREMVAKSLEHAATTIARDFHLDQASKARSGALDGCNRVMDIHAGIKRGRQLERESVR